MNTKSKDSTAFAHENKSTRDRTIAKAIGEYGYSQVEVANHLKLHYSTLSRIVKSDR